MKTKELVLSIIKTASRQDPVSSEDIYHSIRSQGFKVRKRNISWVINRLRNEEFHPIASNDKGYWMATTAAELEQTKRNIIRLHRGLNTTIENIEIMQRKFSDGSLF